MTTTNVDLLLEQQLELFGQISRSVDNLRKVGVANITSQRIDGRLKALTTKWEKFQKNHNVISAGKLSLKPDARAAAEQLPYFADDVFSKCEESFLDSEETMTAMLDNLLGNEPRRGTGSAHLTVNNTQAYDAAQNVRLPRIELPKFNGDYAEWVPFRDLFTSLVGAKDGISCVEKLQYLKASLTGKAAQRLKNVAPIAGNFQRAWDDLTAYYDNKRVLVDAALHSLFAAKTATRESAAELEQLHSEITQALGSLVSLDRPVHSWGDILVYTTVRKLDATSVKDWERELGASTSPPTWERLEQFLVSRIRSLQAYERTTGKPRSAVQTSSNSRPAGAKSHHVAASTAPSKQTCSLCGADHYISSCPTFHGKSAEQRRECIVQKKLCYNCLGPHRLKACRSQKKCRICGNQHHTSLHRGESAHLTSTPAVQAQQQAPTPAAASTSNLSVPRHDQTPPSGTVSSNVAQIGNSERPPVLLATAVVKVIARSGEPLEARALLDQGSEISLVTESLAQRLRLPRSRASTPIVGIGADSSRMSHGTIKISLQSRVRSDFSCTVYAAVLPKLTGYLPSTKVSDKNWPHLQNLELADPHFAKPGRIDLVLGAEVYGLFLEEGIRKGSVAAPIAQQTSLGWILSGAIPATIANPPRRTAQSFQISPDRELIDLLQKFWLQEEAFAVIPDLLSPEDTQCEEHFATTHSRNSDGRYIVRLPFKSMPENLGDSRAQALRMLIRQEKRFSTDPILHGAYAAFLEEYENLGHMRRASETPLNSDRVFYLPHLCVVRASSSTTKYRVVFNGSQRTDRGISLNDCLHEGPKLLTDLADVITRWRMYEFVFSADVAKMFRQILMHPDDQDFRRILWRDPLGKLAEFSLGTVTYGLTSAPFLANRVLRQLEKDEGHKSPLAAGVIEEGTYVDDIYSGAHSLNEGRQKIEHIVRLFKAGGFPLQKWTANHEELLADIPPADRQISLALTLDDAPTYHTLGLTWQPRKDAFVFTIADVSDSEVITKRVVLSRTAQLFDPLGWLAPVVVRAKIFMQELWTAQLEWDETLPPPLASRWKEYAQQLQDIPLIAVPRWLGLAPTVLGIELHGFSDASHAALGAVVYIRAIYDLDDARTANVSAKSKVAPIKKGKTTGTRSRTTRVTTPRLELSAAVLLVRHLSHLRRVFKLETVPVYLWTDSTTALYWIQGHPSRWKDFVRNRVTQVQEILPDARWRHVPGEENPADLASRGTSPKQLAENTLWWQGPAWLGRHSTFWPSSVPALDEVDLEERQQIVSHVSTTSNQVVWELIKRYSRLTRLLRITAWCFRAIACFRRDKQIASATAPLMPEELEKARMFWVKSVQQAYFASELRTLSRKIALPRSSSLNRLAPFLDHAEMIRVGGRLRNALLDPDMTHPLILPRNSILTQLILDHIHRLTLHGGTQVMQATLRRTYWIVGGRTPVRSFVLRCVTCSRQRAVTATQLMGQLPTSRTQPSRPFLHAGVDYAGPFTLKTWRGRAAKTYKGYLIVFVCFSSSAVHLELATDYSTEGFLAAYKRFTGRRGICATLTSDCGTNLVGADAELRRLFSSTSRELANLSNILANDGTKWKFNPPAAPHFGGKWEAAVKSVKFHLKRIVGEALLTYEEFATLLAQIEAVLNSRPLCPLSDDPADIDALTPGHFLVGAAINTIPEPTLAKLPESRLSRWQLLRQFLERFWQRWSTEYLQRFQSISKWHRQGDSINIGSLVLIADERYPPTKWPLARVTAEHPGTGGLIRVATVRTQTSTLKRPIVKLCPLPVTAPASSTQSEAQPSPSVSHV